MRKLFNTLFAWALCLTVNAQTFHNPIIPGYHPDPSICRVGEGLWEAMFHYRPQTLHHPLFPLQATSVTYKF